MQAGTSGVLSISDSGRRVPAEYGSRRVEEGLSRSFSGGGGKPSCPSPSAGDLRELPRVPLRGEGSCAIGFRLAAVKGMTEKGYFVLCM